MGREWCSGEALKAGLEELRGGALAGTQVEEGDWALGQVTQDQSEELGFGHDVIPKVFQAGQGCDLIYVF